LFYGLSAIGLPHPITAGQVALFRRISTNPG
jgi:hypothetical protein